MCARLQTAAWCLLRHAHPQVEPMLQDLEQHGPGNARATPPENCRPNGKKLFQLTIIRMQWHSHTAKYLILCLDNRLVICYDALCCPRARLLGRDASTRPEKIDSLECFAPEYFIVQFDYSIRG